MKKLVLLATIFSISIVTSSFAQSKVSQKEKFQSIYDTTKTLVETQVYQFIGEVVYNNKKREKLDSNSNSISINKSTASGYLTALSSENKSFKISGSIDNYKISFKDEKQQIYIEFNVGDDTFYIDIKPNGNAFLTIKNSDKSTASYVGRLTAF